MGMKANFARLLAPELCDVAAQFRTEQDDAVDAMCYALLQWGEAPSKPVDSGREVSKVAILNSTSTNSLDWAVKGMIDNLLGLVTEGVVDEEDFNDVACVLVNARLTLAYRAAEEAEIAADLAQR